MGNLQPLVGGLKTHDIAADPAKALVDPMFLPAVGHKLHADANAEERRSEEHTSELQSLMRISYAVFCLKKQIKTHNQLQIINVSKYKLYLCDTIHTYYTSNHTYI